MKAKARNTDARIHRIKKIMKKYGPLGVRVRDYHCQYLPLIIFAQEFLLEISLWRIVASAAVMITNRAHTIYTTIYEL